ncbi:MAG: ABC transporter ATP-binding protein [Victivallales bacterium]|jgi:NitT/TauT family transport system ATP-binding protein|nr:ABC transporter ATP-binding protein [Victivallales bacterium]
MYIEIEHAKKHFSHPDGSLFVALEDVSLTIKKGEFICLLGQSGCGKTTLLNVIAGFEKLSSGTVKIEGKSVNKASEKNVMIFQNYGLLPWRSVRRNVELGLESGSYTRTERRKIAEDYLKMVNLSDFADRYPCSLSGGQQQRVAIARALAVKPDILFMDEPFGALDAITRGKMQHDLRKIVDREDCTVIFVTHDIDEAIFLADRIVVMTPNPGKIKRIFPVNIYQPRYRHEPDFVELREQILREFFPKSDRRIEYFI